MEAWDILLIHKIAKLLLMMRKINNKILFKYQQPNASIIGR